MKKIAAAYVMVFILLILSSGYGQDNGISGKVIDKDSKGVQGAQVKLIKAGKTRTTDGEGKFFIEMPQTAILTTNPVSDILSLHNGVLSFSVPANQRQVTIEVYDHNGHRINQTIQNDIGEGMHSMTILPSVLPVAMYFVKLQFGKRAGVFSIINLKNRAYSLPGRGLYFEKTVAQKSASTPKAVDTLQITKDGYQSVSKAVTSYTANVSEITLQKKSDEPEELPPITNGKSARTTRYWDCCKPHCGWHSNMRMCDIDGNTLNNPNAESGCMGGPAFQCPDYAPIEISEKVSYGWAAFNNHGTNCGDCFQLAFDGALSGKQMIVQVINIGDGGTDAFDLLIPGGGVGALNGCSRQWNNAPLGVQYGGFPSTCGPNADCIHDMCQAAFGNKEDLMRGCDWYINWFKMASNPQVQYMKVSCPKAIKDISLIGN